MPDYDSDSSLEDAPDGTETDVILGFASESPSEGAISHLGGRSVGEPLFAFNRVESAE